MSARNNRPACGTLIVNVLLHYPLILLVLLLVLSSHAEARADSDSDSRLRLGLDPLDPDDDLIMRENAQLKDVIIYKESTTSEESPMQRFEPAYTVDVAYLVYKLDSSLEVGDRKYMYAPSVDEWLPSESNTGHESLPSKPKSESEVLTYESLMDNGKEEGWLH